METIINNGATAKAQSQLGNTSVPVSGRVSPDLLAKAAAARNEYRDAMRQIKAEKVNARIAKAQERAAEKAQDAEAIRQRIYKTLHAAKAKDQLALVKAALAEFTTNSVDQQYTLAAMKARNEAAILAAAK